jgi:PAS domain S-box-containing protein
MDETLRQREWLRVVLASIGDAVITTDTEGRVTFLNATAQALTGWKQDEAIGQALDAVFHIVDEQTREKAENPATRALREGTIVGLANHTVLIAKDGTERPIDDSASPIRDEQGHVAGCVLIFRDFTERRQAEKALQRAMAFDQAIMVNMAEGLYTVDREGRVTSMNPAAENIFGWKRHELLGRKMHDVIHDKHRDGTPFPAEECASLAVLREGAVLTDHDDVFIRKDGTFFDVVLSSAPLRGDGEIVGLIVVFRDVSERKQMQAELKASEIRYRRLFESAHDGILILDAETAKITDANPFIAALLGCSAGDLIGKELWQTGLFKDVEANHAAIRALRGNRYVRYEDLSLETKDGRRIDMELVSTVYAEDDREFIQCNIRDITERKTAEAALRRVEHQLAAAIEFSHDAVVTKSLDGIIQTWNDSAERLFGYTSEQVVGRHISILIPADRASEEDEIIARIRAGERVEHFDTVRVRSNGQTVQVSLTISPIKDAAGRVIGASKIARDITERKLLEDKLRQTAAELSEANRRKTEFLALLAHELRNPLAPISNALRILELTHGDSDAVQSAIEMMRRQVGQLVRLVEDLLDVNRISRGKVELRLQRIELASAVNQAVETARPSCEAEGHLLTASIPPEPIHLNADSVRLVQVLGNLLNNACKFTPRGGRISLTVERDGTQAVIRIRDTGIGIALEQLSRIFDMFAQVDSSLDRTQAGLGIGLTLVKALVEMHGGTVEAHSDGVGHGSEFVVRLPVLADASKAPSHDPPDSETAHMAKRRILIVDDNKDSARSLATLLNLVGNETHTAHDGFEALELAERLRPDLMLLDIGLPKLNGYEVCRRIREKAWGKTIVLVALTGWGYEADRRHSKDAGFDHHLVKPAEFSALKKLLAASRSRAL